ncbi:hypothetical protein GGH99_006381 [Coemansia sp. RSA 1285]|nr:hypothetical protein GGH99_006381 [Coemansia sp. RSA 1285]
MFGASQGISNIPAASTSSTGLNVPSSIAARGIFSNHAVAGSTPNLGSFANNSQQPIMNTSAGIVGNGNGLALGYNNSDNVAATHSVTSFGTFNNNSNVQGNQQQQVNLFSQQKQLMMGGNNGSMQQFSAGANKYDIFKSINPHAPSVFTSDMQQQNQQNQMLGGGGGVNAQLLNSNVSGNIMPAGFVVNNQQLPSSTGPRPTGIFAMANPTLSQPQQQQIGLPQNMFQNQMFSSQQGQPQQQQQQQQTFGMNQPGNSVGFGGQVQWH